MYIINIDHRNQGMDYGLRRLSKAMRARKLELEAKERARVPEELQEEWGYLDVEPREHDYSPTDTVENVGRFIRKRGKHLLSWDAQDFRN
jgi:hypothetical protein